MPYRRLPNTDKSRLKAIKTLLDNNELYTVRDRFIEWKDINEAKTVYDKLLTLVSQYEIDKTAQSRSKVKIEKLQRNAYLYMSHFIQVLKMSIERGEIKKSALKFYSLPEDMTGSPNLQIISELLEWGPKFIAGEKERVKRGGRPIYNPTVGMVSTHFDIYREAYEKHKVLQDRTREMERQLKEVRPGIDELILRIWDSIEAHYAGKTVAERMAECEKYGMRYYYRRGEKEKMQL